MAPSFQVRETPQNPKRFNAPEGNQAKAQHIKVKKGRGDIEHQ
jgi:hypothetical protein